MTGAASGRRVALTSRRRLADCFVFAVFTLWLVWFLHSAGIDLRHRDLLFEYEGDQWLLDYSHGFVRRGLPGELLSLVSSPTSQAVRVAGWTITFAALAATLLIARSAVRRHVGQGSQAASLALLLFFPLTLGSVFRNVDRYDDFGIVLVAAAVVILNGRCPSPRLALVSIALFTAVAVACEELLLLFLAPFLAIAAAWASGAPAITRLAGRLGSSGRVWLTTLALALAPALALLALSAIRRPSVSYVEAINRASGHPFGDGTAARALRLTIPDQIRNSYALSGGARYTAFTIAVWLVVYLVGAIAIAGLLAPPRGYWTSVASFAAVAIALNIVFVDARRWWTLAFVTHLALTATLPATVPAEPRQTFGRRLRPVAVGAAVVVSILGLQLPLTTIRPALIFSHTYVSGLLDSWLPGPNDTYVNWLTTGHRTPATPGATAHPDAQNAPAGERSDSPGRE